MYVAIMYLKPMVIMVWNMYGGSWLVTILLGSQVSGFSEYIQQKKIYVTI